MYQPFRYENGGVTSVRRHEAGDILMSIPYSELITDSMGIKTEWGAAFKAAMMARVADLERDLARDLEPEGDEGRSDIIDTMGELLLLHMERG